MKKILMLAALAFVPAAQASFKCIDEKGVTRVGDTPPPECDHVVMYEVSPSGMIMRKIEPTPTPDQLKTRLEDQEKAKEAAKAAAEQKRKDIALLASFSDEKEFDVARDRNIEPLNGRIRNAQDRLKAVDKHIGELNDEMEFYKSGKSAKSGKSTEPPPVLTMGLERAKAEKVSLEKSIVDHQKEIENIKVKFDSDKKRWVALKTGTAERPRESLPPEPVETPASKKR
jgi:hypothetical protein